MSHRTQGGGAGHRGVHHDVTPASGERQDPSFRSTDESMSAPAHHGAGRSTWKAVAIPSEHGGWGLTAEPILLGLLLAFSWPGVAIGVAAMCAFLARTPLKLALVDRRRGRELQRTVLARRIGLAEVAAIVAMGVVALIAAGWEWLIPAAIALPLFAIELWYDIRSRGRRLVPELCGAIGMGAVAAAIVVAGDGAATLAAAAWLVLAARSIGAIPFIRTQIDRLHHGTVSTHPSDLFQLLALVVAVIAAVVDPDVVVGSIAVAVIVVLHLVWVRRSPVPPAKVLGLRQMALGVALVAATAAGVRLS